MTTDSELIGWSVAGDAAAFVEVVCRHESAIGSYLSRRVGPEVAQDLLSEVWLAAFSSRSTYDRSYADARPWMFGVARNALRRHWRSLPAEASLPEAVDVEPGWDPWPAIEERMDGVAALRTALMGLRPAEREVLTLVVWEDLSVADAARALGIPAGTAYRYMHQARLTLRTAPGMVELMAELNTVKDSK